MKFNPDNEYSTHRDNKGGRWYMQDGRKYTVKGRYLGDVEVPGKVESPEKTKKRKDVKERAAKKLEGFKPEEKIGTIQEALNENKAAAAAEAHAE